MRNVKDDSIPKSYYLIVLDVRINTFRPNIFLCKLFNTKIMIIMLHSSVPWLIVINGYITYEDHVKFAERKYCYFKGSREKEEIHMTL